MRKKRDAAGTRAAVMAGAEELFAERGYHGTSIAAVAAASDISDGLILYHFGSKDGLYQAVLEEVSRRYAAVLQNIRDDTLPPALMLRKAMEAVFEFWRSDKTYQRLSLWAHLEGRDMPSSSEAHLTAGLAAYLADLQAQGRFPAGIDPAVFLSAIIGPIHFWFRYRKNFAGILQLEESEEELDRRFLEQHTAMLAAHFHPPSET